MKPIRIIIHHSASNIPEHDDIRVIDEWHRTRGWKGVGYHYFIQKDGWVQVGRMENKQGAGVKNWNEGSLHICLSGDGKFNLKQIESLDALISSLMERYEIRSVRGHRHYNPGTVCPKMEISLNDKYIWGPDKLLKVDKDKDELLLI